MKGLSLLVAIAALGVDVGWETGPGGRLFYTIRIEPVLLEPLREGQAVVSTVDANDRGLRRFQIIVDSGTATAGNAALSAGAATRDETMIQHGWRVGDDGGIDYLVQVTPERLQALANGIPVTGEVDPQVPEIRRIYFYSGVGEVPRVGLPASAGSAAAPPPFVPSDGGTAPTTPPLARPRIEASRNDAAPVYGSAQPGTTPQYSGAAGYDRSRDGGWRSDNLTPANAASDPRAGWPDNRSSSTAGNDGRSLPSWSTRDERFTPVGYDPRTNSPAAADPAQASSSGHTYTQRPASEPSAPPARADSPPTPTSNANWPSSPPAAPNAAWPSSSTGSLGKAVDDSVRPWAPLILTTLGLFASLGANAYLGWLAWSFFWRYRDAATDLARSRTLALSSRQAA